MNTQKTLKNNIEFILLKFAIALVITVVFAPISRAGLNGLYQVDGNTLHLWHLQDSETNTCYDSVSNQNPQTLNIDLTNTPGPNASLDFAGIYPTTNFTLVAQPGANSTLQNNSFQFTNAITSAKYSCLYVPWQSFGPTNYTEYPANPYFTAVANYANTNTGAWCQECLIQPQVNFATYTAESSESLSGGDGPGNYLTPIRGWQWRINYNAGKPTLEFNNVPEGGTNHDLIAFLPTTGPDAIPSAPPWPWYHVAVAYTGSTPTNGDPANVFTMYWTLLDPTRASGCADILTNFQNAFTFTNAANGSTNNVLNWKPNTLTTYLYPSNTIFGSMNLTISGNGRGNITNDVAGASGFMGSMAEYRISMAYRHTNEFVFNTTPYQSAPIILGAPNTNTTTLAQGGTFQVQALEVASQPVTNQWYQIVGGVTNLLASQTNTLLVISNLTINAAGSYQLIAANAYGRSASGLGPLFILPGAEGLFNTGCDPQNNPLDATAPGSVDRHWTIPQDPDPSGTGSEAIVWSDGSPVSPFGLCAANGAAVWVGPRENASNRVGGNYTYQTSFQVDETVVNSNTVISGLVFAANGGVGGIMQGFLNGVETDFPMAANTTSTATPFSITNGLQPGSNTLDYTINYTSGNGYAGVTAFQCDFLSSVGTALTTKPAITNQPVGVTNVYGSTVSFQAVALGAPQMFYYWRSNGVPITQPTWIGTALPFLSFVATNFSPSQLTGTNYFASYSIVFSNSVGSVTSAVAQLDIQIPPQTVTSAGVPVWNPSNDETNIVVYFSEGVDPVTALNSTNYTLNNSASIVSVALGGVTNEVVLTTSVLNPAISYTLTVQNVKSSQFGIAMIPSPQTITVGAYPANVALWLKASQGVTTDATGTNVAGWNDISGNNNNFQNISGMPYEPTLVTNGSYPAIQFVGANETFLQANDSPTLEITSNMAVFAVINFASLAGGTNGEIIGKTGSSSENIPAPYDYYAGTGNVLLYRGNGLANADVASTTAPSLNANHILDVVQNGTAVTHRLDGVANGTGTLNIATGDQSQPVNIGMRADLQNRLTGDIYELILIGSSLSSSDVASMESYLSTEYQVTIGVPPISTNSPPISFSVANGLMALSWPSTNTGWQLQAQTNKVTTGISTNWSNLNPSTTTNRVTIPINLTNGTVFYRLIYTP